MKKESLKEKAYDIIKNKIVNVEYLPNSFLDENGLINEIGVSRTPIREALIKLEEENLVKILPKRGVLVCDITLNEVNEIYEIRLLIEPYIIRTQSANISKKDLLAEIKRLNKDNIPLTNYEGYAIDNDLHQLLIKGSHNSYLISMMEKIYTQNHRLRIISGQKIEHRLEETKKEHLQIVQCLIDTELENAANAMIVHLENSKQAAISAMLLNGVHMLST